MWFPPQFFFPHQLNFSIPQNLIFAPFSGVSQKMGLKSVCISSNERKTKGKPFSDIKGRTGKKLSRITDLPAAKASLQKISEFSSKTKTPPQVSDMSQVQVCEQLFLPSQIAHKKTHTANNRFTFFYRTSLIGCMSKVRLR